MPHHSSHHASSASPTSAHGNGGSGSNHSPHSANANGHFPGLGLPDAFTRSGGAMDFGDELASLMASSPATSNERSTHTPPYDHHSQGANAASVSSVDAGNGSAYRPTHNIFDISAPSSAHYAAHSTSGAHAFSLPHTSHRPEIPPMSQPSSVHTSHLHHAYDHHDYHHPTQHHHPLGRDGFPAHFNSTIPPLSNHHDPPIPPEHQHHPHQNIGHPSSAYHNQAYPPGGPTRETPSPPGAAGTSSSTLNGRPGTSQRRSGSRSRSRARGASVSATGPGSSSGAGPTRTTKSASKRRDSFTVQHTGHHGHGILHHNSGLPSPPPASSSPATGSGSRPQAIVIPSQHHFGRGVSVPAPNSPLGMMSVGMNGMSMNGIGMGVGQTSGWFLPGAGSGAGPAGATPGSAPNGAGAEYSLPTPDSVGHGHAFGQFGTRSVLET